LFVASNKLIKIKLLYSISLLTVGLKYATVCQNSTIQLRCEINSKIVIVKSDFGRDKYSASCGNINYEGDCSSRVNTEELMKTLCGNKQNCDQFVSTPMFPDLCPIETKILRVWYQCVGDGK
jgi:hypothetical protein